MPRAMRIRVDSVPFHVLAPNDREVQRRLDLRSFRREPLRDRIEDRVCLRAYEQPFVLERDIRHEGRERAAAKARFGGTNGCRGSERSARSSRYAG